MKSERLKKLEAEYADLEQWHNLGLVPKKDLEKHVQEMNLLKQKIHEERDRIQSQKESGDTEEYTIPKRSSGKQPFQDAHTIPDIDVDENEAPETTMEMETTTYTTEHTTYETEGPLDERTNYEEDDEDPFSDRNRWRRGILEDPDANEW